VEFFPPKKPEEAAAMLDTARALQPLGIDFASFTYGAGGSDRSTVLEYGSKLVQAGFPLIAHLTCVGHSRAELADIIAKYDDAGFAGILALRGDPPAGARILALGDFNHAADLVAFIRREGERLGVNGGRGFGIGVAGFPEGHPETPNTLRQLDHLKAKCDAGADYIVTQLFFDNHAFHDWRARCELAGIRSPIIAGIMPVTSGTGLKRMADLAAGTRFPAALLKAIARCRGDAEAIESAGIHWATEQCRDLLDSDIAGIHFYTLNKSDATRRIYKALGVKSLR
jgi:methylenetetrahydrofolate reductase (NADPH)